MELPVVIFVSAVTGAISSVVVQVLARKFYAIKEPQSNPLTENKIPKTPAEIPIETVSNDATSPIRRIKSPQTSTQETQKKTEEIDEATEEIDEANILTGSDLSHHVPKLGHFKELNIPSIDDESIQVSESAIPISEPIDNDQNPKSTETEEPRNDHVQTIPPPPTTVPEHADHDDDDATVLVQRAPPK